MVLRAQHPPPPRRLPPNHGTRHICTSEVYWSTHWFEPRNHRELGSNWNLRRSASMFGRRTDHGDQVEISPRSVSANIVLFRKTAALLRAMCTTRSVSDISVACEVKWWMLYSFPVRQFVCLSAIYRTLLLLRDWNRQTVNSRRPWTQSRHQRHPLCWFRG